MLTHDFLYGQLRGWLPAVFSGFALLGPPLLLISAVKLLTEGMRALRKPQPGEDSGPPLTPPFVVWFVRLAGLFLLAVPFLAILNVNQNRPPGVRPGNEGEALGISLIFVLFFPTGLAVTWLSYRFKTKKSAGQERDGNGASQ